MKNKSTASILERVEALQTIQKTNPSASFEWKTASDELQPLFAELAKRQKAGDEELPI